MSSDDDNDDGLDRDELGDGSDVGRSVGLAGNESLSSAIQTGIIDPNVQSIIAVEEASDLEEKGSEKQLNEGDTENKSVDDRGAANGNEINPETEASPSMPHNFLVSPQNQPTKSKSMDTTFFHGRPPLATTSFTSKGISTKSDDSSLTPTDKPPTTTKSFTGDRSSSSMARHSFRSPPGRTHSGSQRMLTERWSNFEIATILPALSTASSTDSVTDHNSNPIQADPELKAMVEEELEDVHSYRTFKLWKSSFLNRFDTFLSDEGAPLAKKAYAGFGDAVGRFVKFVNQLKVNVERGDLSEERTTVRGRNSINEMNKWLVQVMEKERDLIPSRSKDEKRFGYTKFHFGAVLVRDGFREHEQLHDCSEILISLKEKTALKHIADRQQLDEISNLKKQLARFRDIMYDLNLFDVMLKSRQYGDPEDELIFVDLKTGSIGAVTVDSCLEHSVLHTAKEGSATAFRESITETEERQSALDLVKEVFVRKSL